MALIDIRTYPDKVLGRKAAGVEQIDARLQRVIEDMFETMYAAPGIGLAAPQIGLSKRLLVIDINSRSEGKEKYPPLVLINPEIAALEGEAESEEGCLSLPDFTAKVNRGTRLFVKGVDREGKPLELDATGLLAIALQHEIDHLEGTLILDKASSIKRHFYKKKLAKKSR